MNDPVRPVWKEELEKTLQVIEASPPESWKPITDKEYDEVLEALERMRGSALAIMQSLSKRC